jgi:hypothetical protein
MKTLREFVEREGTTRWVIYGWCLRKNLIAMAEKIYDHNAESVFVMKLDETWKEICLQDSIDFEGWNY